MYIHQEYPKMIYKGDKNVVVKNEDEHTIYLNQGWNNIQGIDLEPIKNFVKKPELPKVVSIEEELPHVEPIAEEPPKPKRRGRRKVK